MFPVNDVRTVRVVAVPGYTHNCPPARWSAPDSAVAGAIQRREDHPHRPDPEPVRCGLTPIY